MTSKEDNELLTRTDAGTPMGDLLRRYWIPAFLSSEIPSPDCPPAQIRLLGEELVAFRDSDGRVGLLDEHCSHRGTSLFYGRNEECGLRCIYHGWKYDVEGHVLDTPAEPAESNFKTKLRHPAYPTHEVNGIVFAYMGPRDKMPLFPNHEWALVDKDHTYVTKVYQDCNYLQGLEGECDSAHLSFLHRMFKTQNYSRMDTVPEYETEDTDFGVRMIATRNAGEGKSYVRVSSFIMPVGSAVPVGPGSEDDGGPDGFEVHFYTPADDYHSWRFDFGFRRSRAVGVPDVHRAPHIGPDFRKYANASNHYLQDREMQRTVNYTGMPEFLTHDSVATESMGALYDRSREHLGMSDRAVVAVRRRMLDAVKAFQRGGEPPCLVTDPELNDFSHAESTNRVFVGRDWHAKLPHLVGSVEELIAQKESAHQVLSS